MAASFGLYVLDQIKVHGTELGLDFTGRRPFQNTSDWELAPQPEGIPYPEMYDFFMRWTTPVVIAGLYIFMVVAFNPEQGKVSRMVAASQGAKSTELSKSSPAMTALVFVHNTILCLYSAWTFRGMFNTWYGALSTHSFMDAVCDSDRTFWDAGLGYYTYFFYLSKYYEIVDTIIILLKGRRSSLLQTYHHAGAIITMWAGYNFASHVFWIFTTFNSFIHTLMYAYYALTSVGVKPPGKQYMTSMQITQFWVGSALALWYVVGAPKGCITNPGSRFAVYLVLAYVAPLIYLFTVFARKMYSSRGRGPKPEAKKQ